MHATSVYIACEQFISHQTVERTQACSEDFHTRVVRVLLHTCVFMKFKSSCTVVCFSDAKQDTMFVYRHLLTMRLHGKAVV